MKKINLNQLSMSWNEKQKPRRIGQYAAILIMLLTLGVGQMWADTYISGGQAKVYDGSDHWLNFGSTLNSGNITTLYVDAFWLEMTGGNVCSNTYLYYWLNSASANNIHVENPSNWSADPKHFEATSQSKNIFEEFTVLPGANTLYVKAAGHGQNDCKEIGSGTTNVNFNYYPDLWVPGNDWGLGSWDNTTDAKKMSKNTSTGIYTKSVDNVTASNHEFKLSTYNGGLWLDHGYFDASSCRNIVSSSNSSGNIRFQPAMAGTVTVTYTGSTHKISIECAAPTITFDKEGGDSGTSSQNTYYGETPTSITKPSKTGYTFGGYWTGDNGTGTQIIDANGNWIANNANYTHSTGYWVVRDNYTLHAKWTAKQYTITLNGNGGSGHTSSVKATYNSSSLSASITNPTKTGYTFNGWHKTNGTGQLIINTSGVLQASTDFTNSSSQWTNDGAVTLYAGWTAKNYTVTLDVDEDNHGDIASATTSQTVYYDGATTTVPNRPTAANGYAFMGYFTDHNGAGTKIINADGTWIYVSGYTDSNKKWKRDGDVTLYAYYKKAELTDFTFAPATAPKETSVTITPNVDPDPTGTTCICWGLFSDKDCTQAVDGVTFVANPSAGENSVSFTTPSTPGVYYVMGTLRIGSTCGGTTLSTHVETYVVAEDHTVTIKYMCGDAEIAPRGSVVVPAASTASVTALTGSSVFGYDFSTWEIDDGSGISRISGSLTSTTITISTTYDATIVAKYTEKPIVYFKNTLGWSNVYVTYDAYWDDNTSEASAAGRADGANGLGTGNYGKTYHKMTQLAGTDIWYDEIPAAHVSTWKHWIAFNDREQSGYTPADFTKNGNYKHFSGNIIYRKDFEPNHTMFVPAPTSVCANFTKGNGTYVSCKQTTTGYYDGGYWIKRNSTNSGYSFRSLLMWGDWDDDTHVFKSAQAGDSVYTLSADLSGNYNYYFRVYKNYGESNNYSVAYKYKGNSNTVDISHETNLRLEGGDENSTLKAATAGEYIFTLVFKKNGTIQLSVKYPMYSGDFQVMYYDTKQGKWHPAGIIDHSETENITSFFVRKNKSPQIKWRRSTGVSNTGTITWSSFTNVNLSSYQASGQILFNDPTDTTGVYNFHFNIANNALSLTDVTAYTGNFYIRTAAAGTTGWAGYRQEDHRMTYSDYSIRQTKDPYSHYWMQWILSGVKTEYTVANDYSPCISDTLTTDTYATEAGGALSANANVRFTWNKNNNALKRAYLSGGQDDGSRFLVLQGEASKLLAPDGSALTSANNKGVDDNAIQLTDNLNWVYKTSVKAVPGGKIKLYARYNGNDQYFIGKGTRLDWSTAGAYEILITGTGSAQPLSIMYDFKTNRLIAAWEPADEVNGPLTLNADILIVREHQEPAHNIVFTKKGDEDGSLTTNKTVYGVMRFNRFVLNNRSKTGEHAILPANEQLTQRERNHYYVSFPFDVNVSDVFGFGTYGTHWVLQYYDGKARAKNGLWADEGMTYWKYVPPTGKLNAYEGYLLALSPSRMAYDQTGSGQVWDKSKNEVELYFPNSVAGANIITENCTIPALSEEDYKCEIWRGKETGEHEGDRDYDRRIADSYWRCIGVPSFANYDSSLGDGTSSFSWTKTEEYESGDIHFLYEVDWVDYSLVPKSGASYSFKAMHSYLIQNSTQIVWTNVNKIHNVVTRRHKTEEINNVEFRLTLSQNDEMADQTFVRLTDDDEVTDGFEFNHDMSKELYSTKANIYTLIGLEPVAANSMPISEQKTVVPVGVKIATDGEYTFAIPDGTEGIGVVLVDNVANTRTNLGLTDYTVNLNAGTIDGRFILEISPVQGTITSLEPISDEGLEISGARKVIIDQKMYIIRGNEIYDARGAKVK